MAANSPNFDVPGTWTDLYAQSGYATLANKKVTVQHLTIGTTRLYAGGVTPPASDQGFTLNTSATPTWTGTTDHLWVKGPSRIAVGIED